MIRLVNPVFLDTSGLIALLNADDRLHDRAVLVLQQILADQRTIMTTDWILAETGNGLARTVARGQFAKAVKALLNSPSVQMIQVGAELFEEALALYDQARDKSWGLIDCASFVMMRRAGMLDALTADRHFLQAGFECLLSTNDQ